MRLYICESEKHICRRLVAVAGTAAGADDDDDHVRRFVGQRIVDGVILQCPDITQNKDNIHQSRQQQPASAVENNGLCDVKQITFATSTRCPVVNDAIIALDTSL